MLYANIVYTCIYAYMSENVVKMLPELFVQIFSLCIHISEARYASLGTHKQAHTEIAIFLFQFRRI